MRVLFIHCGTESLGVEYLSSALKNKGHDVFLLYDPMLFTSFRLFSPLFHNNSTNFIVFNSLQYRPDLICFSVESDFFAWAVEISEKIKKKQKIPIVFGGIHPTSVPERVICEEAVDYVCIGEGEEAIAELADRLHNRRKADNITGIWHKSNTQITRNPLRELNQDLDNLAFPDKDLFYEQFPAFVTGAYTIITSRGCLNDCTYCHNSALRRLFTGKGKYLRRRSVQNVIQELVMAKEKYNYKRVTFCDDIFTFDTDWLKEFVGFYKTKIKVPFYCAVHPSFIDEERIKLLVDGGCSVVNLGIQTLNEDMRFNNLNRRGSNEEIIRVIKCFKKTNIFLFSNFIFGLPGQGVEELKDIVSFCAEYQIDFHDVNWLRYYPKTKIVDIAKERGILCSDFVYNIDSGREFKPYAHGGHSFSFERARLRNLVFLSHFLPKKMTRLLLRTKLYNILPHCNMRNPLVALRLFCQKYFHSKKNPYPNLSMQDTFFYYYYYMVRRFFRKRVPQECDDVKPNV